jgi:hypothetical protein
MPTDLNEKGTGEEESLPHLELGVLDVCVAGLGREGSL